MPPIPFTSDERTLIAQALGANGVQRLQEIDATYDESETARANYHATLLETQSALKAEKQTHARTLSERDAQVEQRTRMHRDAVRRAQITAGLVSGGVNANALGDAMISFMDGSKFEQREDGLIRSIEIDGQKFVGADVAAAAFLQARPYFHCDWDREQQRLVEPAERAENDGAKLNDDADDGITLRSVRELRAEMRRVRDGKLEPGSLNGLLCEGLKQAEVDALKEVPGADLQASFERRAEQAKATP